MSFFKIPELTEYMDNVMLFSGMLEFQTYFHENTGVYLPKIGFGMENADKLTEILSQEHEYRLTKEGRNTENILLTIGIPTANRGHLVLKRLENLLKMGYDSEIEIVISKNCNDYYQDEYDKIRLNQDSRIFYCDHGKPLKYMDNWIHTIEMAHGRYVLMVSDEDDVVIEALEHYFSLLMSYPELNLIRARTVSQYALKTERRYGKKGLEAFNTMFMGQNYLSGLIIRKEDFVNENFRQLEKFSDNPFYISYPHEWWCTALSKKGDYMEEPVILISEKESVLKEETERAVKLGHINESEANNKGLPVYSTYKARLNQFQGCVEFIHYFMGANEEGIVVALQRLIEKTTNLFELARSYNYDCDNFLSMVDDFLKRCMEAIDEFPLKSEQQIYLLRIAEICGIQLMRFHEQSN